MLRVVEAGLHATVQDGGRLGHGDIGIATAGAADPLALAVSNALIDNPLDVPVLEVSLAGPTLQVVADVTIGLAGADMTATVVEDGRRLAPGASHRLEAGTTLVLGAATDGARAYLALPGGIASELVLGSASTDPVAGFGGLGHGPIVPGDTLRPNGPAPPTTRVWPASIPASGVATLPGSRELAVLPGPHLERMDARVGPALSAGVWRVSARSDRVGLRLEGAVIDGAARPALVSLPMLPGAVQLPPGGLPIVLLVDAPSVGGYPVPAVVAEVDRPALGQLRPGDDVRFSWVDTAQALSWRRDAEARFASVFESWR